MTSGSDAPTAQPQRGRPTVALATAVALLVTGATACSSSTTSPATTIAHGPPPVQVTGTPAPAGTAALFAVACADATRCWAVGQGTPSSAGTAAGVIDATTDGGTTWRSQAVTLPATSALSAISCPTRRACLATGYTSSATLAGLVVTTVDGGRRWHPTTAPAGAANVVGVQCASARRCLALATDGSTFWTAATTDGGQTWQRQGNLPPGFAGATSLFCRGATCVAAGSTPTAPGHGAGALAVTVDGGATWPAATVPAGTGLLHAATCVPADPCLAVGTASTTLTDVVAAAGAQLTSTDGGHAWTAAAAPPAIGDVSSIACPTRTTCAAVGTRWTAATPTAPSTPVAGVAVSADGGTSWSTPTSRFVPDGLSSVACPGPGGCIAVGGSTLARLALPRPRR